MSQEARPEKLTASTDIWDKVAVWLFNVDIDGHEEVGKTTAKQEGHEHNTDGTIHANNRE